jgi:CheY-like chemotaxis protein
MSQGFPAFQDTSPGAASEKPQRALMVDDDTIQLQATGNLLRQAGFSVSYATSGSQALEIFGRHDFHVAVIDLHLEDVKGVDLIRYLRQAPNGHEVRIVAWTSSNDAKLLEAALFAGADDVYQKTMPPDVIVAKFHRLAAKGRADAHRDTRLLGLELAVTSLAKSQEETLGAIKALREEMSPVKTVAAAWEEAQQTKRALGRVANWIKRFWLWLAAVAAGVAALASFFPQGGAK